MCGTLIVLSALLGLFYYADKYKHRRLWYCLPTGLVILIRMQLYRKFQRNFVEKIVYNTQRQEFTFTMRNIVAKKYPKVVHKNALIYTQDEVLNAMNINYINMENLECYLIGFKFAWVNQELFSHLLDQKIKSVKT